MEVFTLPCHSSEYSERVSDQSSGVGMEAQSRRCQSVEDMTENPSARSHVMRLDLTVENEVSSVQAGAVELNFSYREGSHIFLELWN